jgi:hypothetical protein
MIRVLFCLALFGCASPTSEPRKFGLGLDGGVISTDAGVISDAQVGQAFYVLSSLDAAVIAQLTVDKALGFPKPGFDIGGGAHVPASQSVTTTYAQILANPAGTGYIYLADPVTQPILLDSSIAPVLGPPTQVPFDGGGVTVIDSGIVNNAVVKLIGTRRR